MTQILKMIPKHKRTNRSTILMTSKKLKTHSKEAKNSYLTHSQDDQSSAVQIKKAHGDSDMDGQGTLDSQPAELAPSASTQDVTNISSPEAK